MALTGLSAVPLAKFLLAVAKPFSIIGSDRGTLRVEVTGLAGDGRAVRALWLLVAPPGTGPVTPSLPALAAIRAIRAGAVSPGARPCVGVLSLAALEAEMAVHGLQTSSVVEGQD